MAKYEPKTKATPVDPGAFLDAVENPERRADGTTVCAMLERITGEPPKMWGPSIVGFGSYHYKYDSGHEGTSCRMGFSPRKAELVLYVLTEREGQAELEPTQSPSGRIWPATQTVLLSRMPARMRPMILGYVFIANLPGKQELSRRTRGLSSR